MELRKVLNSIENLKAKGNLEIDINKIEKDSRLIKQGDLFVAIRGFETDGHDYIDTAIENGAVAVIVDKECDIKNLNIPENVALLVADNTRKALAISACNINNNPSRKFKLIGITGTKGKTTTNKGCFTMQK